MTVPLLAGPEPELGAVLCEIANDLDIVQAVVQTARQAIAADDTGEFEGLDRVLDLYGDGQLSDCVRRLREAVAGARLKGAKMVVTKVQEEP